MLFNEQKTAGTRLTPRNLRFGMGTTRDGLRCMRVRVRCGKTQPAGYPYRTLITIAISSLVLPLPISCLPLACSHSLIPALVCDRPHPLLSDLVHAGWHRLMLTVVDIHFLSVVLPVDCHFLHLLCCLWWVCVLVAPTYSLYLHLF